MAADLSDMLNKKETAGETAMQVYTYNEKDVKLCTRVIDGSPWFVVKDLCKILEFEDARHAGSHRTWCQPPVGAEVGRRDDKIGNQNVRKF